MENIKPIWEIKKPLLFEPWDIDSKLRFILVKSLPIKTVLFKLGETYDSRFTPEGLTNWIKGE